MSDEDDQNAKLEGWMRAIEALLIQMPEVTPERVEAARAHLDKVIASDPRQKVSVELRRKLRPDSPLDEHGDDVLRSFLYSLKKDRCI